MQQNLPKLPRNLQTLVDPNELPAVYVQNPMPNNVNGLISGINNQNLNYGNRDLLDLEKRMSKQDITSGLQKGMNFGIPSIAQAQQNNPYHMANNFTPNQQDPIVGVDMSQQDYSNQQKQGMLPSQLGMAPQQVLPQSQELPQTRQIGQPLPDIQMPMGTEQNPISREQIIKSKLAKYNRVQNLIRKSNISDFVNEEE